VTLKFFFDKNKLFKLTSFSFKENGKMLLKEKLHLFVYGILLFMLLNHKYFHRKIAYVMLSL